MATSRPGETNDAPKNRAVRFPYPIFQRLFSPRDHLRPQRWNWSLFNEQLDRAVRRTSAEPLETEHVGGLRHFLLDGFFSSFSENLAITFVPIFALAFGASNSQIGLLTALANLLGTLSLFPGAALSERTRSRKRVVLITAGGASRILFLLLTALPFFVLPAQAAIWIVIIVNAGRTFLNNYANSPWTDMVADLVPDHMRGRYFTTRGQLMGIAALLAAPIGGWMIQTLVGGPHHGFAGYQLVFFAAFAFGAVSTYAFSRIPEVNAVGRPRIRHRRGDLRRSVRENPQFVAFLAGALVWNISIQVAGPFFNVYLVSDLKAGVEVVGYSAGVTSLTTLLGQYLFGRLIVSRGSYWVQKVTGILIPILPALWIVIREPYQVYFISVFSGILWGGYNLSNFNLMLEYSPASQRPRAVALYQTVVFSSAVIGPLIGGILIDIFSFNFCFGVSAGGRVIGTALFLALLRRGRSRKRRTNADGGRPLPNS
ncbi:MAG TPA: MFS transporter [Spirochaetia bacterium]|nr:MFS transporter [Spirochaetia bacterium]